METAAAANGAINPHLAIRATAGTEIFSRVGGKILTGVLEADAKIFSGAVIQADSESELRSHIEGRQIIQSDHSGRGRSPKRSARYVQRGAFRRAGSSRDRHHGSARNS